MTSADLLRRLPTLREFFPRPIIQEWSDAEYRRCARDTDRRLLDALDRMDGKIDWLVGEDEIPL